MSTGKAALVIADIGGYTRFMKLHRLNLTHAQLAVAALLESVIDQSGPLELVKLEGDAAFFWLKNPSDAWGTLTQQITRMRASFLERRGQLHAERMCNCDSCEQIEKLNLKFVAHEGEVAEQRVKHLVELAGVDVILVHRMLKNEVPVPEYVLFTEAVHQKLPDAVNQASQALEHDFEGLGITQTYFVEASSLGSLPVPPPKLGFFRRWWAKVKLELSGIPYLLGLKDPTRGFRHGPQQLNLAAGLGSEASPGNPVEPAKPS